MEEVAVEEDLHPENEFRKLSTHNTTSEPLTAIDQFCSISEIELCSEGEDLPDLSRNDKSAAKGVRYEYLAPAPAASAPAQDDSASSQPAQSGLSLDDLMAQLKKM